MPKFKEPPVLTAEQFAEWLERMQARGLARYDADCARLLGVTPRYILTLKKNGAGRAMALACAALEAGVGPPPP
jgi:hypothetical protein